MPSYESQKPTEVPCRTCTDFKTWSKQQQKLSPFPTDFVKIEEKTKPPSECPLDKDRLGRKTWGFLHTMAAYFPDKPTVDQSQKMTSFFSIFSDFYPCQHCAEDLREDLKKYPPQTQSQETLTQWLCRLHNRVNVKTGKPEFDCSKVNERWRDGPKDKSCD